MTKVPFVDASLLAWEHAGPGVERKVLAHDDHLMMVRVQFGAGAEGPAHTHPHRQVSYVEKGSFRVHIGGEERTLRPGDSFIVPPGVPHGVRAFEEGVLVDIFAPAREDFLTSPEGATPSR